MTTALKGFNEKKKEISKQNFGSEAFQIYLNIFSVFYSGNLSFYSIFIFIKRK